LTPYYEDAECVIYHGRCEEVLPNIRGARLVATDPPYNGVLADKWDNQWQSDADFMAWIGGILAQLHDATTDNATLYLFSSPRLAAKLEAQVGSIYRVICSAVWDKGDGRNGAGGSGVSVESLRTYWTANTERVVVAEKASADDRAKDASGYWDSCEGAKRSVMGDYLKAEIGRAGATNREIAALFPSKTGGLTGCVSNWLLGLNMPTAEQYQAMRAYLNRGSREYDYLRREYEDLRREYEDLRREYEDLRRPFYLTDRHQWGDVWRFGLERNRQHPAQKPAPLMEQIVSVSSREGDTVLDPFMGSGTTLVAAKRLGRRAIGIEIEERYCAIAAERLRREEKPLFSALAAQHEQLGLM
jgi:adenine-specific DNA-methyltransferase